MLTGMKTESRDTSIKSEDALEAFQSVDEPAEIKEPRESDPGKSLISKIDSNKSLQLIRHLPLAEDEAALTYTTIEECSYASKALGNFPFFDQDSRCDCSFDGEIETLDQQACGLESQCVNRLLQVECLEGECRCGKYCQNQRFNKREYAPVEVVKTVQKGYGVRITCDLPADTFVYEYIGEVIGPTAFKKRMKDYGIQGIRHFYFMALDKDTYLDATMRGGKGRFLNHSCNPNCIVAKWTVGSKMRMGIFTKREVKCDEELTFNYNVDRYGHEAQVCHCGEDNCVGFIGGKTQTDIGGMDDLYLDALGIAEEVEILGLRGTKKKKGKQMDDDFIPLLKPILLDEVPKVSAAVRQAISNRRILEKLLIRIQMTSDPEVLLQLLRLHGYSLMSHILKAHRTDVEVAILSLEILIKWPLKTRNKIESSKVEESVIGCFELKDPKVEELGQQLLDCWATLELGYRIPKALQQSDVTEPERKRAQNFSIDHISKRPRTGVDNPTTSSRPTFVKPIASVSTQGITTVSIPSGWQAHKDLNSGKYYYENLSSKKVQWDVPTDLIIPPSSKSIEGLDVNTIIARAAAELEDVVVKDAKKASEVRAEKKRLKSVSRVVGSSSKRKSKSNVEGLPKEKKMMALFSGIVIKVMSNYKVHLDQTQFKKRAKEVTQILCDKESKQSSFQEETYDSLSTEKTLQVQLFTKTWIKKLVARRGSTSFNTLDAEKDVTSVQPSISVDRNSSTDNVLESETENLQEGGLPMQDGGKGVIAELVSEVCRNS